ncbi:MAG: D-alanyl-D-alanine carboxypeptidase/D-alanyl-D-alanine-endopeptidase [Pseudomonadota bacterium]
MKRPATSLFGVVLILLIAACQSSLEQKVEAALSNPEQTGIRWGLVVADMDGTELIAMRADDRFTPASNTKIVTTMASYHALDQLSSPEHNPGTRVYVQPNTPDEPPTVILKGGGDAMLEDAADCEAHCLGALADAVAASGLTHIATVIGDDTFFPFERWGPGWSLEDLQYYYGTAVSALSVNNNLIWVELQAGEAEGDPAMAAWMEGNAYYALETEVTTSAEDSDRAVRVERYPGAETVRIYGTLPAGSAPLRYGLAIDNPAEYAALRFKRLLEARGVTVDAVASKHRPLNLSDEVPDPEDDQAAFVSLPTSDLLGTLLATLPASSLEASLERISKDSDNLHAEIALRRLGRLDGTGSRDYGVAAMQALLEGAGVPEHGYAFHGGSGMSIYNRISPRAMVKLLIFAARQPWFEAWLADQPIGGVDGSLERRFKGTSLERKIFAKTGTLNGANALSGVMQTASGRRLLFSMIANDRPAATRSAVPEMDAALVLIAEAY